MGVSIGEGAGAAGGDWTGSVGRAMGSTRTGSAGRREGSSRTDAGPAIGVGSIGLGSGGGGGGAGAGFGGTTGATGGETTGAKASSVGAARSFPGASMTRAARGGRRSVTESAASPATWTTKEPAIASGMIARGKGRVGNAPAA